MSFGFCPGINEAALKGENEMYFMAGKKILSLCRELGRTNTHGECVTAECSAWQGQDASCGTSGIPASWEQLGGAPGPEHPIGCLFIPGRERREGGKEASECRRDPQA